MSLLVRLCLIVFIFTFSIVSLGAQEVEREWVDKSGKFKINATFQKLEDSQVFLVRTDGAAIKIPFDGLSLEDQAYVRESIREAEARDAVPQIVTPPVKDEATDSTAMVDQPPRDLANNTNSQTDNRATVPNSATDRSPERSSNSEVPEAFRIELPEIDFEYDDNAAEEFVSSVDINVVNQLPAHIKPHAVAIHQRKNHVDVAKAFYAFSRESALPSVAIQLLRETIKSPNKFYRVQSVKLLTLYDAEDSFDLLLAATSDQAFNVRVTSLEAFQYLRDPRAVDELIKLFPGRDRNKIMTVLTAYGPSIENKVFPLLTHRNRTVVADAIRLLERIGTENSIEQLKKLLDSKVVIRMQAKSSIESIQKRLNQ
jgi:hypothetical protein